MFLIIGGIVGFLLATFTFVGAGALSVALTLGAIAIPPFQTFAPTLSAPFPVALLIQFIVVLILYIIAAIATPPVQGRVTTNFVEEFCRGAQIGINASANFLYGVALYFGIATLMGPVSLGLGLVLAPVIGIALGVITFLCVFPGLTRNFSFEAVLGWSSWFMPMSWPYQILGFVFFLAGWLASLLGRPFASLGDWWPGAVVRHGWVFDFGSAAFTIGNFTFISGSLSRASPEIVTTSSGSQAGFLTALGVIAHETGHTLVVAAFGWLFHLVGWIHERILEIFWASGGHAYLEILCEGVRRMTGDANFLPDANPWIKMWAPPVSLTGPDGGNGRVNVDAAIDGVPVDAGINVPVFVGTAVTLDASACSDPDNFPMGNISPGGTPNLGFRWAVTKHPTGSNAAIPAATSATTTFTADATGAYVITLVVTDGAEGKSFAVDVSA